MGKDPRVIARMIGTDRSVLGTRKFLIFLALSSAITLCSGTFSVVLSCICGDQINYLIKLYLKYVLFLGIFVVSFEYE